MCEHCGRQALQTIDELTREHDAALGHVRDAEKATARRRPARRPRRLR